MKIDAFEPYDILLPEDGNGCSDNSSDKYFDDVNSPSYSKYGDYNGYDDNTIDSAFDGMLEATWNTD